jgi:hypothetical protein
MKKLLTISLSVLLINFASSCSKCTNCNECADKTLSNTEVCEENFNNATEFNDFVKFLEIEQGCKCK